MTVTGAAFNVFYTTFMGTGLMMVELQECAEKEIPLDDQIAHTTRFLVEIGLLERLRQRLGEDYKDIAEDILSFAEDREFIVSTLRSIAEGAGQLKPLLRWPVLHDLVDDAIAFATNLLQFTQD